VVRAVVRVRVRSCVRSYAFVLGDVRERGGVKQVVVVGVEVAVEGHHVAGGQQVLQRITPVDACMHPFSFTTPHTTHDTTHTARDTRGVMCMTLLTHGLVHAIGQVGVVEEDVEPKRLRPLRHSCDPNRVSWGFLVNTRHSPDTTQHDTTRHSHDTTRDTTRDKHDTGVRGYHGRSCRGR
jgi:hypothetical protein